MELIKLLKRIKNEYEEVHKLEIEALQSGARIECEIYFKERNEYEEGYTGGNSFSIHLETEVDIVVEEGKHQYLNNKGEPIIKERVLKPLTVIAEELIANIESRIDAKEEGVAIKEKEKEVLNNLNIERREIENKSKINAEKKIESGKEIKALTLRLMEMEEQGEEI